jgi:hypothetical protein
MVTSLLVPFEERRDELLVRAQRVGPAIQQAPALLGELVDPLARPGRVVAPLGGDDAVLLERAQDAVEVAHVDPPLAGQLLELLQEVVAVRRLLRQQEQERRLAEALDAGSDGPLARADAPPRAGAAEPVPPHERAICKSHMLRDDSS